MQTGIGVGTRAEIQSRPRATEGKEGVFDTHIKAFVTAWLGCSGSVSPGKLYCSLEAEYCCVAHAGEKGGGVKDSIRLSGVVAQEHFIKEEQPG